MYRIALVKALMIIIGLGIFSSLLGCGGGTSTMAAAGTGRASFTIQWSATGRAAVNATGNSVRITLSDNGTGGASHLVTRPSSNATSTTVVFDNLSSQTHTFVASSYVSTDGTGVPLATATATVSITAGKTIDTTFATVPTIQSVTPSPTQASLLAGKQVVVSATVINSDGGIALISPDNLLWVSSNSEIVALTVHQGQATLTAVKAGTASVTVTEATSGKSGTLQVTVSAVTSDPGTPVAPTGNLSLTIK